MVGPLLLRRVGGRVRALLHSGRELTIPLSEVVRAYSAPGGGITLLLETGKVDYFRWHAAGPEAAGRRLAAVGDWLCTSCGSSLYRDTCNDCGIAARPRVLWVDADAKRVLLPVELGPGGPLFGGRRLSPWEVLEIYAESSGQLLAGVLALWDSGLEPHGTLLRVSPDWFRRPVLEVCGS